MNEHEDLKPAKTEKEPGVQTQNTNPGTEPQCSGVYSLKIDKEEALSTAEKWIDENITNQRQKDGLKFGKAVLVYYPFWKYLREDGGKNKTIYRPACGTLLTGLQNMHREDSELIPMPEGIRLINPTVKSSVYLNEIHGIARGESLVAVPLWVISYKFKDIIYMVEVDGVNGTVYPEWHPIKEPVNWNKIALYCIIPMMILSLIAVGVAPWLFIVIVAAILVLIYYSKVISLINAKRKEGRDGT